MARLQQIFACHSDIIILIRAFVAYIPQRQILGMIRGPGKRHRQIIYICRYKRRLVA